MAYDITKDFNHYWENPHSHRICYVAYKGLTLVRVEDIVTTNEPRNTRLMTYEDLVLEMMQCDKSRRKTLKFPETQSRVMLKCG